MRGPPMGSNMKSHLITDLPESDSGDPQQVGQWQVYLLRCRGGELYTGITTDVGRRFCQHSDGRGAKALRGKGPLSLLLSAPVGNRGQAQRVEARIKRLPKQSKETLVSAPGGLRELIDTVLQGSGDKPDIDPKQPG